MPFFLANRSPYEIRGAAGHHYNLISSPQLSVNANFIAVPEKFQDADFGDTLLGNLGVVLCAHGRAQQLEFDIQSGRLINLHDNRKSTLDEVSNSGRHFVYERYMCDLERMACTWEATCGGRSKCPVTNGWQAGTTMNATVPRIDSGLSRWITHLSTAKNGKPRLGLVLSRNAAHRPNFLVDCSDFRSWPEACWACEHLLRYNTPTSPRHEYALLFTMPQMIVGDRFQFSELQLQTVVGDPARRDVHGLLGHRTHGKPTLHVVRASKRAKSHQFAWRKGGVVQLHPMEEMRWEESKHTWERSAAIAGLTRADQTVVSTLESTGEGIIEGASKYYRVPSLHSHEFRYSRLNCTTAPSIVTQIQ